MVCKNCCNEMSLDDVDYNFKGNKDNYYICDCGVSCIEEIRFNKQFKLKWFYNDFEIDDTK